MTKQPLELLLHIKAECEFIFEHTEGMDIEDLSSDEVLKRAVVRSLEIIGEAAKSVPEEFKLEHDEISWRDMTGMRNVLIHKYSEIDLEIVFDVIRNKIPNLFEEIWLLIEKMRK